MANRRAECRQCHEKKWLRGEHLCVCCWSLAHPEVVAKHKAAMLAKAAENHWTAKEYRQETMADVERIIAEQSANLPAWFLKERKLRCGVKSDLEQTRDGIRLKLIRMNKRWRGVGVLF